ncbi:hypothetical protein Q1695_011776 [Nippostrongylus brasiliensis]|nr:hypothetical protein Q1695_011776 [Nippostrongylus brasiliensis]
MVIERAVASWKPFEYGTYGSKFGFILVTVSVLLPLILTAWAMSVEDFSQSYIYCSSATDKTSYRLFIIGIAVCVTNCLTLAAAVILFICNNVAIKSKTYELRTTFQLRENSTVLRIVLPQTIFQTLILVSFSISNTIIATFNGKVSTTVYRTLFAAAYIVPYYTLLSPLLMWFVIKRIRRLNNRAVVQVAGNVSNKDLYFKAYAEMWAKARPNQ